MTHSGNSNTIRESNQASGIRKVHNAYYVRKAPSCYNVAGQGAREISFLACEFSHGPISENESRDT